MKNDLFTIGSITIHGYGLMIGIGIIAAYYLAEYRANKRGMDVDMILCLAIGIIAGYNLPLKWQKMGGMFAFIISSMGFGVV